MLADYVDFLISLGSPLSGFGILLALSLGGGVPLAAITFFAVKLSRKGQTSPFNHD